MCIHLWYGVDQKVCKVGEVNTRHLYGLKLTDYHTMWNGYILKAHGPVRCCNVPGPNSVVRTFAERKSTGLLAFREAPAPPKHEYL